MIIDKNNFSFGQGPLITGKLALITFLSLILMIPLFMISNTIHEREGFYHKAQEDIGKSWSLPQTITGPFIIVPYIDTLAKKDKKDDGPSLRHHIFLPQQLNVQAVMHPETRHRGIFQVTVYRADLNMHGKFQAPPHQDEGSSKTFLWKKAMFVLTLSDLRGINALKLVTNNQEVVLKPGSGEVNSKLPGVHADLAFDKDIDFSITLDLKGTELLKFLPIAQETTVDLTSPWPDPSFVGNFLPVQRTVDATGFRAFWKIPYLARSIPESFDIDQSDILRDSEDHTSFGVRLFNGTDHYRQSERATKYGFLFILYTFLAYFLFEVVKKIRIHIFQYILTGFSLMSFFVMLTAFSEHTNFTLAYWVAAVAIITQVSLYACKMIRGRFERLSFIAVFAALYVYLFTILRLEDYAFLIGALGLFVVLSFTMYYTRNVSWFEKD
jgi:inner membrane protein